MYLASRFCVLILPLSCSCMAFAMHVAAKSQAHLDMSGIEGDSVSQGLTKRLAGVVGFEGRTNDIVYCRRQDPFPLESRVVFFGGDVQDYPENMESHRDNFRHTKWNLENVALLMHRHFNTSDIFVIRPNRIELKTFSCYDSFVPSNNVGAPTHVPDHKAFYHLKALITNAANLVASQKSNADNLFCDVTKKDDTCTSLHVDNAFAVPLILIGFSKGCVVLNQLLHELHLAEEDSEVHGMLLTISDMFWLDGGHAGGSQTWITDQAILKSLAGTGIKIHVFMTPYQVSDQRRPWIKKEEKIFTDSLRKMKANIERKLLFEEEVKDIGLHFRILEEFKRNTCN